MLILSVLSYLLHIWKTKVEGGTKTQQRMLSLERCLCPISTLCDITNGAASCLEKLQNSCVLKLYSPFFSVLCFSARAAPAERQLEVSLKYRVVGRSEGENLS